MAHQIVVPKGSAPPLAPYSPGVLAGNTLYLSGMLAMDANGNTVGVGDVMAQTECVLEQIKAVVEAVGGAMGDVVFNAIFLKDLAHYAAMNAVYKRYFPKDFPARYCVRADLVKPEFLVEIVATAHLSR
jgi:aminoacrylate peracid reductase